MEIIEYPRNIILCNTRDSSVAANLHVAFFCLKKEGQDKKKNSGRSFCVSKKICVLQVYFTSKSWQQNWWCVNQSFKYTFYQCF